MQDKKILEVNVERGMQHNQKIVFRGEADEAVRGRRRAFACNCALTLLPVPSQPDTIPGDIIFIIQQKEHAIFKRKGAYAPSRAASRARVRGRCWPLYR